MSKKWRSGPQRYLGARPIYEKDWPKLIEAMFQDGLVAITSRGGILWYHGGYIVQKNSVRAVWGLSKTQMTRLNDYIYVNDPFLKLYEKSEEVEYELDGTEDDENTGSSLRMF